MGVISRADVAHFLVRQVDNRTLIGSPQGSSIACSCHPIISRAAASPDSRAPAQVCLSPLARCSPAK